MMELVGKRMPLDSHRPSECLPIHPDARKRLRHLMSQPEMAGISESQFISRACELAEVEIGNKRTR